jgi:hypothetical protein
MKIKIFSIDLKQICSNEPGWEENSAESEPKLIKKNIFLYKTL